MASLRALRENQARRKLWAADGCVFLSRLGGRYRDFPKAAWRGAIKRAGLDGRGLTPHSMRRTFATYYEGQDRDLMDLLGHADLNTTLKYRRWRQDRTRTAVEALDYGIKHTQSTRNPKKASGDD